MSGNKTPPPGAPGFAFGKRDNMHIACYIRCDATFRRVEQILARACFHSDRFVSEIALMRAARRRHFDLILVDTDGSSNDQESIYSWLNCRTGESTPVVMLAAATDSAGIVQALNAGADDCIAGQVDPEELIARLHAILRRCGNSAARPVIELNGFRLERQQGRLFDNGVEVELTPREFMMAWLLFSAPGTYQSRETISSAVWGTESEIAGRTIEQHIYKLRKKLNLCPERGAWIRTAYNRGYSLQIRPDELASWSGIADTLPVAGDGSQTPTRAGFAEAMPQGCQCS